MRAVITAAMTHNVLEINAVNFTGGMDLIPKMMPSPQYDSQDPTMLAFRLTVLWTTISLTTNLAEFWFLS
jgi:hypothetical protein